jgi:CheY-like chemotaxis protein
LTPPEQPRPHAQELDELERRASKVTHDLNNLVSVILGYATLLLDQLPAEHPGRRMAEEVQEASERAAEMARELLEIRRAQRSLEDGLAAARARDGGTGRGAPSPARGEKLTVLVVEDDASVRRLAESILSRSGYSVLIASECEEAMDCLARHPGGIDLLLTDVVLPGASGRELVNRARDVRPNLRVLYMSGYSPEEIPGESEAFLPKPFSPDTLLARVRSRLAGPRD